MTEALPPETAYEIVTREVLAQLAPGASIQHDVQVPTRDGESSRQVDVYIEGRVAGIRLDIAIDCKHYGRALHVGDVDAFIGLMDDIGCSKGVLVGLNGFGEGAVRRAVEYGPRLQLARIFSAEHAEFSAPVPTKIIKMEVYDCKARGSLVNGPAAHRGTFPQDPQEWRCRAPSTGEFMAMDRAKSVVLERSNWFNEVDVVTFDDDGLEIVTTAGWENLASITIELQCKKRFKGMRVPFVEGVALVDQEGKLLAQEGLLSRWIDTVDDAEWVPLSVDEAKRWRDDHFE